MTDREHRDKCLITRLEKRRFPRLQTPSCRWDCESGLKIEIPDQLCICKLNVIDAKLLADPKRRWLNHRGTDVQEIFLFAISVLLGAGIWSSATGGHRLALSISALLVSGVAATILSGEYHESWIYLLIDLGEAASGFALVPLIVSCGRRQAAAATHTDLDAVRRTSVTA
jgi:hypothetical protein